MNKHLLLALMIGVASYVGCANEVDSEETGQEQSEQSGEPVSCDMDGEIDLIGLPCANPGSTCEWGCEDCFEVCSEDGVWESSCNDGSELEPPCG